MGSKPLLLWLCRDLYIAPTSSGSAKPDRPRCELHMEGCFTAAYCSTGGAEITATFHVLHHGGGGLLKQLWGDRVGLHLLVTLGNFK